MARYDRAAYGPHHKKQRQALVYLHEDGSECEVCAQPMYLDGSKNWDGKSLEADHEDADTSQPANRLIHSRCNKSLIGKWAKHGPGWVEKYGLEAEELNVNGGTVTAWA